MICFFVRAEPKGQPRARAFSRVVGGKAITRMYTPGSADGFKGAIQAAAYERKPDQPMLGPVRVSIYCHFPRPKSHYRTGKHAAALRLDAPRWHTCKPDTDNLQKVVLDALTSVGYWRDDAQVCDALVQKSYVEIGGTVGCQVKIEELLRH